MLKQNKQRQLYLKILYLLSHVLCEVSYYSRKDTINMFTFYHIAKVIYLYYNINKTYNSHEIQKSIATMSDSLILLLRGKV